MQDAGSLREFLHDTPRNLLTRYRDDPAWPSVSAATCAATWTASCPRWSRWPRRCA
ncbi:hypothetical protein ACU4GD_34925 [Cupriavidus basilensis]